jgi:hypothetical protein
MGQSLAVLTAKRSGELRVQQVSIFMYRLLLLFILVIIAGGGFN